MPYYESSLTGAELESILTAIKNLLVSTNNNKALVIDNGQWAAKAKIELQGGTLDSLSVIENGTYTHSGDGGYSSITVNVPTTGGTILAALLIIKEDGDVCTVTQDSITYSSSSAGTQYIFGLPISGTWTVTCNGVTNTVTVSNYEFKIVKFGTSTYLPASEINDILGEAYYSNYPTALADTDWGGFTIYDRTQTSIVADSTNQCVSFTMCKRASTEYVGYNLSASETPITLYSVAYLNSGAYQHTRVHSIGYATYCAPGWNKGSGTCLEYTRCGNDTDTSYSSLTYHVMVTRVNSGGSSADFFIDGVKVGNYGLNGSGQLVLIGTQGITSESISSADISYHKFFGLVNGAEDDEDIVTNCSNLMTIFGIT